MGGLTRVDRTLEMPGPYTVQLSPDEYRCFVLDWPETQDKYVVGFSSNPRKKPTGLSVTVASICRTL